MTSVLLPEGELRVARCDMLDKLIAVGDGDAALLYLYILRHGGTDGSAAARALRLSADHYERAAFTLNTPATLAPNDHHLIRRILPFRTVIFFRISLSNLS